MYIQTLGYVCFALSSGVHHSVVTVVVSRKGEKTPSTVTLAVGFHTRCMNFTFFINALYSQSRHRFIGTSPGSFYNVCAIGYSMVCKYYRSFNEFKGVSLRVQM